jgi:predicted site-specific integrase-resolvase
VDKFGAALNEATENSLKLLNAREAAEYLRISIATLNRFEKQGKLTPLRTPGGHRRYTLVMLNHLLGLPAES